MSTSAVAVDQLFLLVMIFFARILDVSVGTLRIIFVSKGLKYLAAALGFVESLIWILAITKVMQNLGDWQTYVAFALGFSAGNFIGVAIEERIAIGNLLIRIITKKEANDLVRALWSAGYGITSVDAQGETGPVKLIFTVAKRKNLDAIIQMIKSYNPQAFYTIEDMRFVNSSYSHPIIKRTLFPRMALGKRK